MRKGLVRLLAAMALAVLLGSVASAQTPQLTSDEKAQIAAAKECLPKIQTALDRLEGSSRINVPGCGWVEQVVTVKESPLHTGNHTVCWAKQGGVLPLVLGWKVQHCESFTITGSQMAWFQDPPTVSYITGLGYAASLESSGAQWITNNYSFRHYSTTNVTNSLFGWTVGTVSVNFDFQESAYNHHH